MEGARFVRVLLRRADLRIPFPPRFTARLKGLTVRRLDRRGKYLLAVLSASETLVMHLGMSGSFRVERSGASGARSGTHDHVVFLMSSGFTVTFNDPRRFGFMDLLAAGELAGHRALSRLGPEPLSAAFDAAALARACRGKKTSLKAALLDQRVVAGLGNIYVSEALHRARLSPQRRASSGWRGSPTRGWPQTAGRRDHAGAGRGDRAAREAYRRGDRFRVYGRTGERCRNTNCAGTIAERTLAGRTTFYCPACQR
jgi:formamidopyrimidine-DNA glycosylase